MAYEFIRYEVSDEVATITLNRPKQLNALNPGLKRELRKPLLRPWLIKRCGLSF